MSGPHADQPIKLKPHEIVQLLAKYRAHRRTIDGTCSCGAEGCGEGFDARGKLWADGINPDWPPR